MTAVLSIRIDRRLKELMSRIQIDWRSEIEEFIRRKVREYLLREFIARAREARKSLRRLSVSCADLIREDRDAR